MSLHNEVWRKLINARIATSLMMETKLQQQAKLNRRLVRKTQDGTLGQATSEPEDGEEMRVQVGDNVYQAPPAKQPSGLKSLLIGAALTAAGLGWLVPIANQLLNRLTPPPAVAAPADPPAAATPAPDRDTKYTIDFED